MKSSDLNYTTIRILNSYYNEKIHQIYPTINTENIKIREKEALAKAIDYYGGRYSFDKLSRIVNEERVPKFNYLERQQGLAMIEKMDNGEMTKKDIEYIQANPRLSEIYETISDKSMRSMFMAEVKDYENNELDTYKTNSFSSLVGKIDLLGSISEANNDNLRREQQDRFSDHVFKKKKDDKKLTKKGIQKEQKQNQPKL